MYVLLVVTISGVKNSSMNLMTDFWFVSAAGHRRLV